MFNSFEEVKRIFDIDFKALVNESMFEIQKDIIELNQIEQLSEGVDALGQTIKTIKAEEQGGGNVYSTYTIAQRKAKGLQTDNVDLKFKGAFWKTFKLVKVSDGWEIQVDYSKGSDDIRDNFDSKYDFTGLTQNNMKVMVHTYLLPVLNRRLRQKLGL
jgi:hypothetical protein